MKTRYRTQRVQYLIKNQKNPRTIPFSEYLSEDFLYYLLLLT